MGTIDVVPMLIRGAALAALLVLATACTPPGSPTGISSGSSTGALYPVGAIAASSGMVQPGRTPVAPTPPDPQERALATAILTDLQIRSFAENREYCGYLVRDGNGRLVTGPVNAGIEDACPLPQIPRGFDAVASFHTHSTYSPWFQSEFPTVQDMLTDAATGTNGFISTPGGRLWYVDGRALVVTQLCGRGCLPQDPNYDPTDDGVVRQSYTLDELRRREVF
jgi:hypothetical protein